MAWDPLPQDKGFTGDAPRDALTTALERVAEAYRGRFGRAPLLHELLHALRGVLAAGGDAFLHDPERLDALDLAATLPARMPVTPDGYVGSWGEEPQPEGTWYVTRGDDDVLRCHLRVEERRLMCDYEILDAALDDDDARLLIAVTLLVDHARRAFAAEVDDVSYAPLSRPRERTILLHPR